MGEENKNNVTTSNLDYQHFLDSLKTPITKYKKVLEIKGDLFSASEAYSLAHCVTEDFSMRGGISYQFRKKFHNNAKLLEQNISSGGTAVIKYKDRFIYYLVTKEWSHNKPTLQSLWNSLREMKKHMVKNKVTKLAIPRIGCGYDRLVWGEVKQMLEFLFQDIEVEIKVYNLDLGEMSAFQKSQSDVDSWGTQEIATWLKSLQLSEYIDSFSKNDIQGRELLTLTRTDLEDLDVTKIGHIKRILQAIKDLANGF